MSKGIRTIMVAVDGGTGVSASQVLMDIDGKPVIFVSAGDAHSEAVKFAVKNFPGRSYWYKAVVPLYKGSRVSLVLCSDSPKNCFILIKKGGK